MPIDFLRQEGLVTPEELPAVTVVGAGGIGSFTLLALAKMGVQRITAFDDDTVEDHNLPNQMYPVDSIGQTKIEAAASMCLDYAGVDIIGMEEKLNGHLLRGVVVSGVDSMAARKEIWKRVKAAKKHVPLYVEARMGAEVSRIYSINPSEREQVKAYDDTLYDDKDALPVPCTERAIIYNGLAIAALIASQVKKWSKKEDLKWEIIFDLKTLTLLTQ